MKEISWELFISTITMWHMLCGHHLTISAIIPFQLGHVCKLFCATMFSDLKDFRKKKKKSQTKTKNKNNLQNIEYQKLNWDFFLDVFKTEELHRELKFYTSEDIALYFMVLDNY